MLLLALVVGLVNIYLVGLVCFTGSFVSTGGLPIVLVLCSITTSIIVSFCSFGFTM